MKVATRDVFLKFCKIDKKILVSEQPWNFIKKENPAQVFSCEIYEIFLEHLFYRTFPGACSIVITSITNFLRFSSNLPDMYLQVFWFTLHMFLFYLLSNNHTNSLTLIKFVLCVYWLSKLPSTVKWGDFGLLGDFGQIWPNKN